MRKNKIQYLHFSFLLNIFRSITRQIIKLKNNLLNLSHQHAEISSFGLDFLAESQGLVNCYSFRYNLISIFKHYAFKVLDSNSTLNKPWALASGRLHALHCPETASHQGKAAWRQALLVCTLYYQRLIVLCCLNWLCWTCYLPTAYQESHIKHWLQHFTFHKLGLFHK